MGEIWVLEGKETGEYWGKAKQSGKILWEEVQGNEGKWGNSED